MASSSAEVFLSTWVMLVCAINLIKEIPVLSSNENKHINIKICLSQVNRIANYYANITNLIPEMFIRG
ncbi:MAG: hypothetical protein C0154_10310 [Mucilaginibacter sp.]|nr:MAG: hypothetical protein C0154_10310 [Mucilaginibacter sp.]PMP65160.1 MAG: hypothetical protein C0191_04280 [Mucilaginibacter sp.]